ncbi:Transcriptional elongation regulator MINIYO [Quillaja saponaria]|uniref:Transcriptional elongation regulator MINIYO n=1 Tax=Quillaja saponaria TaxID=32244 RepID=A0AAD7PW13_QUISA|nr:Transcriptional elongation regulator MINIYO [Quillaja saponaria]
MRASCFFDISEKIVTCDKDICTAPVFRSKSEIDVGFLPGGFWKYNAKSSNVLPPSEDIMDDDTEGKHTIKDDIVVAGQDFAAGLVWMKIIVRLRYLLETDPTAALEECIISILIVIARHSPLFANAIMKCERLIQIIVHRFTNNIEIQPSMIKSVSLLKELKNVLSSALLVEQLRFWQVCVQYGYYVSYFSDLFPALCLWLNPPSIERLNENNIFSEFASISREVYLVLEALARRLPNFFSQKHLSNQSPKCTSDDKEVWSWSYVSPMVDLAAKWIATKGDPHVSKFFKGQEGVQGDFVFQDLSVTSMLWLYSAVTYMLLKVLERVTPDDTVSLHETDELVPWLPEFVPKIGLELIKYRFLGSLISSGTEFGKDSAGGVSFIKELFYLRQQSDYETSVASVCCLSGLVKVIATIDNLIQSAKTGITGLPFQEHSLSREGEMLRDGILRGSVVELRSVLNIFINLVASEWHCVQSVEMFGTGCLRWRILVKNCLVGPNRFRMSHSLTGSISQCICIYTPI